MNANLNEAIGLLAEEPKRAEGLCRAVLSSDPHNIEARVILAEALRRQGEVAKARVEIEPVVAQRPELFAPQRLLGLIQHDEGNHKSAAQALRRAADLEPSHSHVWRELGDALRASGDEAASHAAYLGHALRAAPDPRLVQASIALREGRIEFALERLRAYTGQFPNDVLALVLLAESEARSDRPDLAERSLRRAIELAPAYTPPVYHLVSLLSGLGRLEEAISLAKALSDREPANLNARALLADMHGLLGDHEKAVALYESILAANAKAPVWNDLGHALNTLNRNAEAVAAYHSAIQIAPGSGAAHWGLANLKTYKFSEQEIAHMGAQLRRGDLPLIEKVNMGYALARAFELRGDASAAFEHYAGAAKLYRTSINYDPEELSALVSQSRIHFSKAFFEAQSGGASAADPIFVVGLPRSGSTLVEQILASHSLVEGTMELPTVPRIVRSLVDSALRPTGEHFVLAATRLSADRATALGEDYMRATRVYRKTPRPFFVDKMPNNFQHIGLIQMMLPNAKIIDVRRHPLACGLSCFKQHFGVGQYFTYDLAELGKYYADYVSLMQHYDSALPGRVYRINYEQLVADPETEIRELLDHCALPFEPSVLSFHETHRPVRTPSAEQVRRPISAESVDSWRAYEQWLRPLKSALGPVLAAYPDAP
ncbi:MAG: sulfotransferase [Vitreimonas sp.]